MLNFATTSCLAIYPPFASTSKKSEKDNKRIASHNDAFLALVNAAFCIDTELRRQNTHIHLIQV